MLKILYILDDGHGAETKGKRTPKFHDGSFMKENEFNRAVVDLVIQKLEALDICPIRLKPEYADISLKERVTRERNYVKKMVIEGDYDMSILISVHANANTEDWNSANGIETFHYSDRGKKLAEVFQRNLIAKCHRRDRGVKQANFYIIKNSTSPAVLLECGFMTNMEEALMLLSDTYRGLCADAIVDSVLEINKFHEI